MKIQYFFLAARPRTWSAAICPVLIGTAIASTQTSIVPSTFILTSLFALCIQIGTNFSNDYFDFVKGADTAERIGPQRAVQQGWIAPRTMLIASLCVFLAAFVFAIPLIFRTGVWSLVFAFGCILLGLLYTGGPKPLAYLGFGELCVLIFFGPVAVVGTYFLQTNTINDSSILASFIPGFLSTAILIANNLRDERTDRMANKKTIIVRFGRSFGKMLYAFCLTSSFLITCIFTKISFFLLPWILFCITKIVRFKKPEEMIGILGKTSFLLLLCTAVFCGALFW